MKTYTTSDIMNEIRPRVKNCPDFSIQYAIMRSVRIFCQESWLYQKTIDLPLVNDLDIYELNLSEPDEVIAVKAVKYNDYPLQSMRGEDIWFTKTGDQPYTFIFEPPNLLYLKPIPHNVSDDVCLVRLVLQPQEDSDFIPDVIYREYKKDIASGAISYLTGMQEEVWTNPSISVAEEMKFQMAINKAKRKRMFGNTVGSIRVRPRSFVTG